LKFKHICNITNIL